MAKITIIKSSEPRKRYRFISEPLERNNHLVTLLDTGKAFSLFSDLLSYLNKERRPDLVIFVGMGLKELFVLWLLRAVRIRVIFRLGGDPVLDNREIAYSAFSNGKAIEGLKAIIHIGTAKLICRKADELILVNEGIRESMGAYLRKDARVSIVPQFCTGTTPPIPRSFVVEGTPILLTAANLKFRKKSEGVIWLIEHLANFVRVTSDALVFRVAGAGEHLADVREYVKKADLPPALRIEVLGYVQDMDRQYQEADLFIYNSEHDATPNVLLESKRWSLPLLVNEYKPFRSIVENECSGIFYHRGDFMRQLTRLLTDEALRRRIGETARSEHENIFSLDAAGRLLERALFEQSSTS